MDIEITERRTWRTVFRFGVPIGLVLLTVPPVVVALLDGPGTMLATARTVAKWTLSVGAVVVAGSLIGLVFTERPGQRRSLHLRVLAGFIVLMAILGTLYALGAVALCGMNSDTYVGWGCRGTSIYWRDPLLAIPVIWAVAGCLVWLALRAASTDSA
jgi:hypothetical protein